ncbi:MAG: hypothetical protein IJ728_14460 [Selenomonadaceae bacterium]|nr:hypothetical protein [Selenomonadaceae bacterium]MBR1730715.1 hypothetical protein [Selenomonadaceae bacterium]
MGAGQGSNFGNTVSKFIDNIADLLEKYGPLSPDGFFGKRSNDTVRHIISNNPLETMRDFVNTAIKNASIKPLSNGKGIIANFADKFMMVCREKSSSDGSPAVEIWTNIRTKNSKSTVEIEISGQMFKIRYQKIHFISEDN